MLNDFYKERFKEFIFYYDRLLLQKDLLADAACRQSYRDYFFSYYRKMFGQKITSLSTRHLKWFRRLTPVTSLPSGSRILDFGGGYGMDTIFFASCGYRMTFYERTKHHIAICSHLKTIWEKDKDPLSIVTVLGGQEPDDLHGSMDAVFMDEVAHHIEPPDQAFLKSYDFLKKEGHLFLLEPNFYNPLVQMFFLRSRGFKTVLKKKDQNTGCEYLVGNENIRPGFKWNSIAARTGFQLVKKTYICPYGLRENEPIAGFKWRQTVESKAILKHMLPTHITFHFQKKAV